MEIEFNLNKKYVYSIILILIFIVGVISITALSPKNPGEDASLFGGQTIHEISPPSGCSDNQILKYIGGSWSCVSGMDNKPTFHIEDRIETNGNRIDTPINGLYDVCAILEHIYDKDSAYVYCWVGPNYATTEEPRDWMGSARYNRCKIVCFDWT